MPETFLRLADFKGHKAWDARDIAEVEGASVRLHWTDAPYIWHVNDGTEVFLVLDGIVDMHVREGGIERVLELSPFDAFVAKPGDEHVAHPRGEARILVIERKGSV
ncbi:MAG: cupin [Alphaproteobacteria bacterium HGW-Alphaproteobacteria-18]|nr:MAG: cupin [Alphaproteobacteria bacterium HGW-Alphaproteobacteria-18]